MASDLLSGSMFGIWIGVVGAAAAVVTPATGVITPDPSIWTMYGSSDFEDGAGWENMDERATLMYQGSKGMPSEERRTGRGLMLTGNLYDHTPQVMDTAWGTGITTTAAGTVQVGVHRQNLDLPVAVPEHAVLVVMSSAFDDDGSNGWLALTYIPKATVKVGAIPLAIDPAGLPIEIKQLQHSSSAYWDIVFADAI